jgi:hypothetical protein
VRPFQSCSTHSNHCTLRGQSAKNPEAIRQSARIKSFVTGHEDSDVWRHLLSKTGTVAAYVSPHRTEDAASYVAMGCLRSVRQLGLLPYVGELVTKNKLN